MEVFSIIWWNSVSLPICKPITASADKLPWLFSIKSPQCWFMNMRWLRTLNVRRTRSYVTEVIGVTERGGRPFWSSSAVKILKAEMRRFESLLIHMSFKPCLWWCSKSLAFPLGTAIDVNGTNAEQVSSISLLFFVKREIGENSGSYGGHIFLLNIAPGAWLCFQTGPGKIILDGHLQMNMLGNSCIWNLLIWKSSLRAVLGATLP